MVKARLVAVVALLLAVPLGAAPPSLPLLLVAPADITWESTARPDSTRGSLWGDPAKGPFAYFNRYAGGWQLPLHYHSNQLSGVIVSGTFVIHVAGQDAKQLPAGSYFSVPAKTRHTDACVPGSPCVVYFSGDDPLDRVNVE
jgi:Cupin domain